jgi:outer membrane protein assembly factor BamB
MSTGFGISGDLMKFNRVLFFVLVASLAVLLSACGTPPATNWPGLAADDTHIYLAEGQYVYLVQPANGSEVTIATADGPIPARFPQKAEGSKSFYAVPALTKDGQMVVGSAAQSEHTLYSIDPVTGATKWTFTGLKNPWLAGALALDDTIYAPAGDGKLYAFSLSGQKRWDLALSNHSLWTLPVTDGKLIYLATLDHEVYAINPEGQKVWKAELDNGIIGAPSILDGTLYVGTLSGNLYALNTADGSQKWIQKLEGNIWGTPASDGKTVYVGTVNGTTGNFYLLNAANGAIVTTIGDQGSITAGPLLTTDQVIYVTETGLIQSLDLTGKPKWQAKIENAKFYTTPLLMGNIVVIAPMNAKFLLVAYDLNGAQQWTFSPK